MADSADRLILMAVIGKAQGLNGQMRLKSFAESAESLADYGMFYDKTGREYEVASLHIRNKQALLGLKGVADRSAAEQMAGLELFVRRSQLPAPQEDEFYQEDLLGCAVFDTEGEFIGHASGFFNFGGGDLLEVTLSAAAQGAERAEKAGKQAKAGGAGKQAKAAKCLLPFSKAAVPRVESGRLVIDRAAAGLGGAAAESEEAQARAEKRRGRAAKGGKSGL